MRLQPAAAPSFGGSTPSSAGSAGSSLPPRPTIAATRAHVFTASGRLCLWPAASRRFWLALARSRDPEQHDGRFVVGTEELLGYELALGDPLDAGAERIEEGIRGIEEVDGVRSVVHRYDEP